VCALACSLVADLSAFNQLLQEFESKPASYYMQPLPPFPPKKLFKNDPSFIESYDGLAPQSTSE